MMMSSIGAWGFDPFARLRRLERDIDRLFGDFVEEDEGSVLSPPLNVWAGADKARIAVRLPGVDLDDIDLEAVGNRLTISGEVPESTGREDAVWLRRERLTGSFSRTIELPFRVDVDKAEARFENGILLIDLPRPEEDRPRSIKIKAKRN